MTSELSSNAQTTVVPDAEKTLILTMANLWFLFPIESVVACGCITNEVTLCFVFSTLDISQTKSEPEFDPAITICPSEPCIAKHDGDADDMR